MEAHESSEQSGTIFRGLEPQQRAEVERAIHYAPYPSDHIFYRPDSHSTHLFFLQSGDVQVYKTSTEGRVLKLAVLKPVTVFGEMFLLDQSPHNTFARSVTACLVGTMEHEAFLAVLGTYPTVSQHLMQIMGRRLRDMENKLVDIAFKSVSQRLAKALLDLSGVPSAPGRVVVPPVVIRHTHQQLAEVIGSYRETVTRTIGEFRENGLIRVEDDVIYLTNLAKLHRLAGG